MISEYRRHFDALILSLNEAEGSEVDPGSSRREKILKRAGAIAGGGMEGAKSFAKTKGPLRAKIASAVGNTFKGSMFGHGVSSLAATAGAHDAPKKSIEAIKKRIVKREPTITRESGPRSLINENLYPLKGTRGGRLKVKVSSSKSQEDSQRKEIEGLASKK